MEKLLDRLSKLEERIETIGSLQDKLWSYVVEMTPKKICKGDCKCPDCHKLAENFKYAVGDCPICKKTVEFKVDESAKPSYDGKKPYGHWWAEQMNKK